MLGFEHSVFNSFHRENISPRCCSLHSIVEESVILEGSVLEYCHLKHILVGKDCILR